MRSIDYGPYSYKNNGEDLQKYDTTKKTEENKINKTKSEETEELEEIKETDQMIPRTPDNPNIPKIRPKFRRNPRIHRKYSQTQEIKSIKKNEQIDKVLKKLFPDKRKGNLKLTIQDYFNLLDCLDCNEENQYYFLSYFQSCRGGNYILPDDVSNFIVVICNTILNDFGTEINFKILDLISIISDTFYYKKDGEKVGLNEELKKSTIIQNKKLWEKFIRNKIDKKIEEEWIYIEKNSEDHKREIIKMLIAINLKGAYESMKNLKVEDYEKIIEEAIGYYANKYKMEKDDIDMINSFIKG